jgi:hypothetical protein
MGFIGREVRRAKRRVRRRARETFRNAAERWCPECQKRVQPFHTCVIKTDFKRRKTRQDRATAAQRRKARNAKGKTTRTRPPREAHPYQSCTDMECPRPLCKAFKEGIQACPLSHG